MNKKALLFVLFCTAVSVPVPHVSASWLIDRTGTLVEVDARILGEEVTTMPEAEDGGAPNNYDMRVLEKQKNKLELEIEARKKKMEKAKEMVGTTIENNDKKLKIRQETKKNDKTVMEKTTELPENESLTVERQDGQKVKIKPLSQDALEIEGEKTRTRTNFHLEVGEDNALIFTNKQGEQRTLTVLPDTARQAMEKNGFIASGSEGEITETSDGKPVYKFEAQEEKKVFGLFRRRFKKTVEVSGESGEILKSSDAAGTSAWESFLSRFAR